ncbi:unnamed protein product [Rhizoctonia solani]|uniref:Uncharacterized protein n=1 Tax=Rhizoctonia solani TaxID=456999 RepID=A0A8H2XUR5_9AGAM|nr:unnamed protein product [Rhizoctonia solani]
MEGNEVGNLVPELGNNKSLFRRRITFENNEKRVEIIDNKLYALGENETYVAETALQAMSELGQQLLNQSDAGVTQVAQIADRPSQTPSLEATIQKFRKMSMNRG